MEINLKLIEEPFVMQVENDKGNTLILDANENIGGKGKGMSPMQALAGALAGCISVDVLLMIRKQKAQIDSFQIQTKAVRASGIPSPFESFHLVFNLKGTMEAYKTQKAIQLTIDKYCSVASSLKEGISITFELNIN